jgi:hypothetical protein
LWDEVRHPEHDQFSVAEMLEHERPHLMPMPTPFDGYVEKPGARVQHLPGVGGAQPLLGAVRAVRADGQHAAVPGSVVVVAGDEVVARHDRLSNAGETRYDWQHYIPLLQTASPARCATARRSPTCPSRCSGCAEGCCATRAATA